MDTKQQLLNHLLEEDWIKTPRIIEAFRSIDRKDFVQDETKLLAYFDEALSIGSNQTISQPSVVAFMLEELNPQEGERILDVGAGSGWTSALLAVIVGPRGKVIALDIVSKVVKFGTKNLSKYNFIKRGIVEYICQDADIGYKAKAPFDRILVSAASLVLDATSLASSAPRFSNLSSSSISLAMVTPSLVICGAPNDLPKITFRPLGPSVIFTVLASRSMPRFTASFAFSAVRICLGIIFKTLNPKL